MKRSIIVLLFAISFAAALEMHSLSSTARNRTGVDTMPDEKEVEQDARLLQIPEGYRKNLHWDLVLDSVGKNGSLITWQSGNPQYISDQGKLLKLSPRGESKVKVVMTATITAGTAKRTKTFDIEVANEEPRFDGYLFAYFEGSGPGETQEQLRFAASADGIHWQALNNNEPIIPSDQISETGGIRDPHILRGEDGKTFYIVATDMLTVKNGWDTNPGIVMLKSKNLTDWSSHGYIDLAKTYPDKFANVKWVWAPQTIYDPAAGKYLVYFTVRYKDNPSLDFYCAYANKSFTGFEAEPRLMFKPKYGAIDGDIIYKDGLYHFFYKGNTKNEEGKEIQNGIQQAVGKTLEGPWAETFKYVDAYSEKHVPVEGSGIFKLNNSNTYILMYDMYTSHRYEFQRSDDLFNFSTTPESFTKNFNPRHGTVMSITAEEAVRLNQKWAGVPSQLLNDVAKK